MYQRAKLYLTRKRGQSIILMIVFFILITSLIIGIKLKMSADIEEQKIRSKFGASFRIKSNVDNPKNFSHVDNGYSEGLMYSGPEVTNDMIQKIEKIDGVSSSMPALETVLWTNLELIPAMYADLKEDAKNEPQNYTNNMFSYEDYEMWAQGALVVPCVELSLHEYFRIGACSLKEGRGIQESDEYKAVISSEVAERNNICIGDEIRLENREGMEKKGDPKKRLGKPMLLEVIGIFDIHFQQKYSLYEAEWKYVENYIFTDWATMEQAYENSGYGPIDSYMNVTFFVDDPEKSDSIIETIKEQEEINFSDMIIEDDERSYKKAIEPLNQISILAMALIITGTVGCTVIVYLLMQFWIQSRKKEFYIFSALGVERKSIFQEILMEAISLGIVALIIVYSLIPTMTKVIFTFIERKTTLENNKEMYSVDMESVEMIQTISQAISDPVHLQDPISIEVQVVIGIVFLVILSGSALDAGRKNLKGYK